MIHHVSSVKNASFDPDPVITCNTGTRESHRRLVCRCLTYSSSEDDGDTPTDEIPSPDSTLPVQDHVDAFQQSSCKYTLNVYVNIEEEEEEEDTGIWKRFLIDIHYHMDYVHILVHIQITKPPIL